MDEGIEYSLHDEIAYLKSELAMVSEALSIIADMDDYHQALVYDTLCDLGYYEHEDNAYEGEI